MNKLNTSLLLIILFGAFVAAQQKYQLKLNPEQGLKLTTVFKMLTETESDEAKSVIEMTVVTQSKITQVLEDSFKQENLLVSMKMNSDANGFPVHYDSENVDQNDFMAVEMHKEIGKFIGKKTYNTFNFLGELLEEDASSLGDLGSEVNGSNASVVLPDYPVAIDEVWHQSEKRDGKSFDFENRLVEVNKQGYIVESKSDILDEAGNIAGKFAGTFNLHPKNLIIESFKIKMEMWEEGIPVKVELSGIITQN